MTNQVDVLIHHSDVERSNPWGGAQRESVHQFTANTLVFVSPALVKPTLTAFALSTTVTPTGFALQKQQMRAHNWNLLPLIDLLLDEWNNEVKKTSVIWFDWVKYFLKGGGSQSSRSWWFRELRKKVTKTSLSFLKMFPTSHSRSFFSSHTL